MPPFRSLLGVFPAPPKRVALAVLQRLGWEIRRSSDGRYAMRRPYAWGRDYLPDLARLCPEVRTAFVVGAYTGTTSLRLARRWPRARIYNFEPTPATFVQLEVATRGHPAIVNVQAAVGDKPGEATLHRTVNPDCNSLLMSNPEALPGMLDPAGQIAVPVVTLDDFCAEQGIEAVDYLHADVQGFELPMLRGAAKLLSEGRIGVLLTEVCFDPLYHGQSRYHEVCAALDRYGYRFVTTQGLFREADVPRGGNFVFVRP